MKSAVVTSVLIIHSLATVCAAEKQLPNPYRPDIRPTRKPAKTSTTESAKDTVRITPRIIGGRESTPNDHPWLGALVYADESDLFYGQYGGGVLIHPYWVLTAGHCISGMQPEDIDVVFGAHDLDNPSGSERRIAAAELILHPFYNDLTLSYDIGLIRLATPAPTRFPPLPLVDAPELEAAGIMSTIAGWGVLDNEYTYTDTLQEVDVPIVALATANASPYYNGVLDSSMLAAGYAAGGKDSAVGDSGGPLTVPGADGEPVVAGIVSHGPMEGSALANGYGIYSKVSASRSFIFSYVMPQYNLWEALYGVTGRYRDTDGDGALNIDEFAFGRNPLIPDRLTTRARLAGGHPEFSLLGPGGESVVSYLMNRTTALDQPFAELGSDELITGRTDADASRDWITFRDPNVAGTHAYYTFEAEIAPRVVPASRWLPLNSSAEHTVTPMDEPVAGTNPARYQKCYALDDLVAGRQTTLILRSDDFNASLALHNASTGALLTESSGNNAGGSDERIIFTPAQGINYEARVANVTGNFMLAARDFNGISSLPFNSTYSGTLSSSDSFDPDYLPAASYRKDDYLFSRSSDTDIRLTMTASAFTPNVIVFNAETGQLLSMDIASGTATVDFLARAGVNYLIRSTSSEENRTGSYQLKAIAYSLPTIAVDQTLSGTLSSTDPADPNFIETYYIDDYALTGATAGETLTINLSSSAFDAYLYLINRQTGEVLDWNDDISGVNYNSRITFTAEADTSYLIRVSSAFELETGSYQLSVD